MNTCECEPTSAVKHCSTAEPQTKPDTAKRHAKPRYNANETEHGVDLRVYVPGADKSGVTLSLDKDVLTVIATRALSQNAEWRVISQELPSEDYRLLLRVDNKIDPERIAARLENGVLEVTLPYKEAAKARVIEVA